MYSALKVNGKRLYELAREGKTVERKSRKVTIHDIRIREVSLPRIRMEVDCSKGTYIRTLCHDIGEKLGTGGCMESLLRTRVGRFRCKDSLKLDEVEAYVKQGRLSEILIPTDEVFFDLYAGVVEEKYAPLAYNGNPLSRTCITDYAGGKLCETESTGEKQELKDGEQIRVYDGRGRFIGIYKYEKRRGQLWLEKMFFDRD